MAAQGGVRIEVEWGANLGSDVLDCDIFAIKVVALVLKVVHGIPLLNVDLETMKKSKRLNILAAWGRKN